MAKRSRENVFGRLSKIWGRLGEVDYPEYGDIEEVQSIEAQDSVGTIESNFDKNLSSEGENPKTTKGIKKVPVNHTTALNKAKAKEKGNTGITKEYRDGE